MLPMLPMSPILLSQKGQFVGSIENQMLPIGDQLEGKVVWTSVGLQRMSL
jgi:hypothetical protein